MSKKRAVMIAVTLVVVLAAAIAIWHLAIRDRANSFGEAQIEVKIGATRAGYYLPFFVAQEKGFFAEQNLRVDLQMFAANKEMFNAFLQDRLECTAIGSAGAFPLEAEDPGRLVFISAQNNLSYSIMVGKSSPLTTIAELHGKRIATWPSPTATTFLRMILKTAFDPDQTNTEIDRVEYLQLNDAVKLRQCDAIFTFDYYAEQGVSLGITRPLALTPLKDLIINPCFNGGAVVQRKALQANPLLVRKLAFALEEAAKYIREHEKDARLTAKEYCKFPDEVLLNAPLDEFIPLFEVDRLKMQQLADKLYDEGLIKQRIEVSGMLYDFAAKAH